MFDSHIFRNYDIRGTLAQGLTEQFAFQLGQAFALYLRQQGLTHIVVGRDNRPSALQLTQSLVAGLLKKDCHVIDLGEVPTPLLNWSVRYLGSHSGIMVTGSHNVNEYNGFKFQRFDDVIFGNDLQAIQTLCYATMDSLSGIGNIIDPSRASGGTYLRKKLDHDYLHLLSKKFSLKKQIRVVVDAGNGMAHNLAPNLLRCIGCRVIPLYCESDGTFPNRSPDSASAENLIGLRNLVIEHKADIGLAYDADVNRLGVIDNQGHYVMADLVLLVLAKKYFYEKNSS